MLAYGLINWRANYQSNLKKSEEPDVVKCSTFSGSALLFETKSIYFLRIITCDPSKYTVNHSDLTVPYIMEKAIGLQRDNWVDQNM